MNATENPAYHELQFGENAVHSSHDDNWGDEDNCNGYSRPTYASSAVTETAFSNKKYQDPGSLLENRHEANDISNLYSAVIKKQNIGDDGDDPGLPSASTYSGDGKYDDRNSNKSRTWLF
jgi:hypothetical protein